MITETTSPIGLIKIKNNPTIYASKKWFKIYLNGEFIIQKHYDEWSNKSEKEIFQDAKDALEELKFGTFFIEGVQEFFDSLIKE